MTLLQQLRQSPRWLVVILAFAAFAVTATALVPHDEPEERTCLVCKANQQAISDLVELVELAPPLAVVSIATLCASRPTEPPDIESGPCRAPPV